MKSAKKIVLLAMLSVLNTNALAAKETSLSYEQKMQKIDSLRAYVQSSQKAAVAEHAPSTFQGNAAAPAANAPLAQQLETSEKMPPFICDETSEHNCKVQELMHDMENGQAIPRQKSFVLNGKHRVSVVFVNDKKFPAKYAHYESFKSVPKKYEQALKNKIFEHYLGVNYESYNPELLGSNVDSLALNIYVESSDELLPFLDDDRVEGIHHAGNYVRDIQEGHQ
ncbi:MAG: hypothetical protein JKX81_17750 [Arenicella sp.]|nr:hypothetical protein [Arenicella sp.]